MRQVALAIVCLSACSRQDQVEAFALRTAAPGELAPFYPGTATSFTATAADLVYSPLLRVVEGGRILPGSVRRWERLGPDEARVEIDPDLRFSDGSPVRPDDVIRSLAASGLEARRAGEWIEVSRGKSSDPLEVALLYTTIFRDAKPAPLGTGPFRYVEGDARHIVLERIKPAPGRIARVEILSFATPRDAFARALRGDVNAVMGLDERQRELLEGVPGLSIVRGEAPHAVAVVMNAARFSGQERLALAASLPVRELVRAYGENCSPLGASPSPEPLPQGRALQVAATVHDPGLPRVALALRRALGPRGGDVAVEQPRQYVTRTRIHDFDVAVTSVVAWPPVMLGWFARTGAGANIAAYSNALVDQAFDRGDMAAVLEELRRDPPLVLVCRRERIAAVDARIHNATLGSWSLLATLPDWEVSP